MAQVSSQASIAYNPVNLRSTRASKTEGSRKISSILGCHFARERQFAHDGAPLRRSVDSSGRQTQVEKIFGCYMRLFPAPVPGALLATLRQVKLQPVSCILQDGAEHKILNRKSAVDFERPESGRGDDLRIISQVSDTKSGNKR